jgi:hypothetical protein
VSPAKSSKKEQAKVVTPEKEDKRKREAKAEDKQASSARRITDKAFKQ